MNGFAAPLSAPPTAAAPACGAPRPAIPGGFGIPSWFSPIVALCGASPRRHLPRPAGGVGRVGSRSVGGGGGAPPPGPDLERFDRICDHLRVLDEAAAAAGARNVRVATCRMLRQEVAERHGGFYTAGEFRVAELLQRQRGGRFLELGRSCVLRAYRNTRTVELLWHGIWSYAVRHGIDALIGCASFAGTDPDRLALPLSYLHHYARSEERRV